MLCRNLGPEPQRYLVHVDLGEMLKHNYKQKNVLENIPNIIATNNLGNLFQGRIVGNSGT